MEGGCKHPCRPVDRIMSHMFEMMIKPKKEESNMKNEEFYNSLSEEVKKNLAGCKTQEEIRKVLTEAGVEPLDDELLDAASGGSLAFGGGRIDFMQQVIRDSSRHK